MDQMSNYKCCEYLGLQLYYSSRSCLCVCVMWCVHVYVCVWCVSISGTVFVLCGCLPPALGLDVHLPQLQLGQDTGKTPASGQTPESGQRQSGRRSAGQAELAGQTGGQTTGQIRRQRIPPIHSPSVLIPHYYAVCRHLQLLAVVHAYRMP